MFRKFSVVVSFVFCIVFFFLFSVSAESVCDHNFTPADDKSNLICNGDMSHSYYCLNGCGEAGTVEEGLNGREKCILILVHEISSTCIEEGKGFYFCSVCGLSTEKALPLKKHDYNKTRRLPTCISEGYDIYTCSVCKDSYKDNFDSRLSHIPDGGTVEILPTYEKIGVLKISCRVCDCVIGRKTLPQLVGFQKRITSAHSVSGFKIKSAEASYVKLSWKESEGAVSYKVFYSTDKKKWNSVSVKETSVTVKKLKSATKYYFKIIAVGTAGSSKESKIISVCTKPSKPTLQKVKSAGKSAAVLQWKKLTGVSGYELSYTSDSFSKKKSAKIIRVTKGTKKTLKKLKKGKKYYFRIRAYKTYGSDKIFGAYSEVRTFKIK